MFRTIFLILSSNVTGSIILMIRNLLIADMLSLEDYGIGSTFVMAMAIIEMLSEVGLQQQMVQASGGNDERFQAALHGFKLIRGAINAAILLALAPLIAGFFRQPELTWAYQVIACVPLIMAFGHSDVTRLRRQMRFGPNFIVNTVPKLVSTFAVWPLFLLLPDYRLMIAVLILQGLGFVICTFVVSERRYRVAFDRAFMTQSMRFGWPLLLNGVLMFAVFNGERMIVGRELGMVDLAILAMGLSLSLTPVLTLSSAAASFFMPQLAARKADRGAFLGLSGATFQGHFILSGGAVLGIAVLGGPFLHFLLGAKYAAAIPLLSWLAVMQGIRLSKGGSSTVAMAQGLTGNSMLGNLPRVLLLPVAWYVLLQGGSLLEVIALGILGEALGFVVALGLAVQRLGLPRRPLVLPLGFLIMVLGGAMLQGLRQHGAADWMPDPTSVAIMLAGVLGMLATSRDLRAYIAKREVHRYDE